MYALFKYEEIKNHVYKITNSTNFARHHDHTFPLHLAQECTLLKD